MAAPETHTGGIMPATNDLVAVGVLSITYIIRLATLSTAYDASWWLTVTTDAVIPLLAGVWLWVAALYALYKRCA